ATFGVNLVMRSLNLQPGDEILTSNHEYGACDNAWMFAAQRTGAKYVQHSIPLGLSSAEIANRFLDGITPRTKIIFISHITSQTALRMPVEAICREARGRGILTLVDGAHSPGQIPLNLPKIGADFYVGNCHKWLLAPKGAGFLHTRPEHQESLDPLVVGWGWGENSPFTSGSSYIDKLEWLGTKDPAAYLSVPDAIRFQKDHNWPQVGKQCHQLLRQTVRRACAITGLPSVYSQEEELYHQLAVVPLPTIEDLPGFKETLYERYKIEIPTIEWQGRQFLRISVQGYNTEEDLEIFLGALEEMVTGD
ncbi:MAG: aminotransferase class V-fold PLP-dependent enzyme, partial [Chloroflexota bacterium]|nr:aminotransferase class V-fold PLP-dependent enzyme [Chloroflexota bacterium]